MKKCLVEVYNNKIKKSEWINGVITGYRQGDVHEDFQRVDVKTNEGVYEGCHPDCIKEVK